MTPEIRQIRADEGLKLRAIRLQALADAPTAFGSTLAQEEKFPERVWHGRAGDGAAGADRVTFVAEQEGQWIGIATGLARDQEKPNDAAGSRVPPQVQARAASARCQRLELEHMITRRAFLGAVPASLVGCRSLASGAGDSGAMTAILEPVRVQHRVPALAGAYVRGGDLEAIGAVGHRVMGAVDAVGRGDRFHLGSCTKSMTATVIAGLVEQGRLDWRSTIGDVLDRERSAIHPRYHAVTLRELLSHVSGLPEDRTPDAVLWPRIRALSGPMREQRRQFVRLVLAQPPAAEPRARFQYSNAGYTVAGAMAETVTGGTWEDLMRERLFDPLSLATMGFGAPGSGHPWGHTQNGCRPVSPLGVADNPAVIGPAGTVHGALADWATYASLHLRGAQGVSGLLLKRDSFRELHRDHFGHRYALGWGTAARDWARGVALTHAGSNTFWYAVLWLAPARNAAFLAATNCGSGFPACDAAISEMIRYFL